MSATEARTLINTAGRQHTFVAYFTKQDGTLRRMVARYDGTTSRKPNQVVVWDLEKGAYRTISLDRVQRIKVLGTDKPRRQDRPPVKRSYADVKAELDELFY